MNTRLLTAVVAAALLLAACKDNAAPQPAAASQPAAAPEPAADSACSGVFTGNHSMVYDKDSVTIDKTKCKEFTIIVRNIGHLPRNSRGHNFVIAKDTDEKAILADGMEYGSQSNFLKPGDNRVVAYTKLAGGGEEQRVTFPTSRLSSGNNYVYFCSFLGHRKMRGKVNVIE